MFALRSQVSDKPDASSLTSDDTLAVADDDTSSVCDVTSRTTSTAPAATGAVVPAPTTQELFGQGSVDSGPVGSNSSSDSRMSDADITADFAAWRADLVARGFFKPRTTWQLVVFLSEPLVMMFVGCWLMKVTGSVWPGGSSPSVRAACKPAFGLLSVGMSVLLTLLGPPGCRPLPQVLLACCYAAGSCVYVTCGAIAN